MLVKLNSSAIPVGVVVGNLKVFNKALICAIPALINMNAATAGKLFYWERAVFCSNIAPDRTCSILGFERKARVIQVDAATCVGRILANFGVVLQIDGGISTCKKATAPTLAPVLGDFCIVHIERAVIAYLNTAAT